MYLFLLLTWHFLNRMHFPFRQEIKALLRYFSTILRYNVKLAFSKIYFNVRKEKYLSFCNQGKSGISHKESKEICCRSFMAILNVWCGAYIGNTDNKDSTILTTLKIQCYIWNGQLLMHQFCTLNDLKYR